MRKLKNCIVRITFSKHTMLFGNSYEPWQMQVEEYMRRLAKFLLNDPPVKVETSNSPWKSWGGLKWCCEENFQHELNREGCQVNEPDNPNPRKYADMTFSEVDTKTFQEVRNYWKAGQRFHKVNQLNDEEYQLYKKGELKITV